MTCIRVIPLPGGKPVPASYSTAGVEPPLRELMNDPILHAVLQRDRISLETVWQTVRHAREVLNPEGDCLALCA